MQVKSQRALGAPVVTGELDSHGHFSLRSFLQRAATGRGTRACGLVAAHSCAERPGRAAGAAAVRGQSQEFVHGGRRPTVGHSVAVDSDSMERK